MRDLEERLQAALADRYALGRELGRGGMAVVLLGRDLRHDRAVAIKVLRQEIAAALGGERFLREIQIAAKLHHPHILPLYDSGAAGELLYYVMPYVEGESLRQRLEREKQLPVEEAMAIARQVAGALAYAHRNDVVHRDIKPENILLESGEAVVADFGIARAITAAGGDQLTQTGNAIGTPLYMSPEQGAGGEGLDGRSDVYSLACVLYEMLAGHPPFAGGTAQAILARHTVDPVPPLRTARATVPTAVEQALGRALAKLPADRYATALQFAEALGGPVPFVAAPARGGSRRLGAVLGVGLALAALGAGRALRGPGRPAPPPAGSAPGSAAYDAYLRGTYWRQLRTRDGLLRAIDAFEEALVVDSAYAPAYAGLSSVLSLFVLYQYSGGPEPVSALARAIVLADRAIALDPNLAEGFAARGWALTNAGVSVDTAVRDLARAVALRPNSGQAHSFYVAALGDAGRDEDAVAEAQTATELDPLAPAFRIALSSAELGVRRYDVALREARRAGVLETAPLPVRIRFEGLALLLLGRPGECLTLDLGGQQPLKAMCLEALGRHREAAAVVDSLAAAVRAGSATWAVPEGLGMYYAWLGDVEGSLQWYGAAYRAVQPRFLRSGLFDRVRNNARFQAGIERLTERNRVRLEQAIALARTRRP